MKIIEKLRNYIYDKELQIHVYKNNINIVNYIDITDFNDNKIIVKHRDGDVVVKGAKLVVTRLLNDEILISGDISQIELR